MSDIVEISEEPIVYLDAAAILGQDDINYKDVDMSAFWKAPPGQVKAWVRIRTMPGTMRDQWEKMLSSKADRQGKKVRVKNFDNLKVTLIQKCVVNAQGEPLFNINQIEQLNTKSSSAIDYLFQKCQELNKLTKEDVEDLVEDLDIDLSDESGSDSQQS